MQKSKLYLRKLIVTALMIALYLLLDSVSVDITPTTRLTVSFLTRALVGFLCGPMLGMAAGALSDILGAWIFPRGAYYPGFTITAIVGGLLYGLILYKRKPTLVRSFAAKGAINVVCNLLMNTFWLSRMQGQAAWVLLPGRLLKNVVLWPIESLMLFVVIKAAQKAAKQIKIL